ncbi:hypothetical protein AAFC00_002712 [Neodothiora populina]|uniref:Thioredoxin n=1 Tax=Neodothiora populina TaxID=2781224 RepID=A0ABR3P7Z8_9PEZI
MDVELYVYDLSKGLARVMSMGLVGIQIDAVYHTSIVLGGVEYFYGAGVQTCLPGQTHHGQPMEIIKLDKTELPMDVVLSYLESLKELYTYENYDLFSHNCNNFTHDFSMFLVGKGIPEHITSLPSQVLNTPFGAMIKNQLDSSMRSVTQAAVPPEKNPMVQAEAAAARRDRNQQNGTSTPSKGDAAQTAVETTVKQALQQQADPPHKQPRKLEVRSGGSIAHASEPATLKHPRKLEVRNGTSSEDAQSADTSNGDGTPPRKHPRKLEVRDEQRAASAVGSVRNITQFSTLDDLLSKAKEGCAVVFFTSSTCAPCKIAYPTYDALAAENEKIPFVKVDINQAHEIAMKYQIRATPTFMTFLHGKKDNEWSGADPSKLRANVGLLIQQAYPPHPHLQIRTPTLQFGSLKPVSFSKIPPLDKLTAKMGDKAKDPVVAEIKTFLSDRRAEGSSNAPLPDLPAVATFMRNAPKAISVDNLFTAYDLMRCTLLDPRVSGWFAEESGRGDSETLAVLFSHVLSLIDQDKCPYNLRLVTIQLASNLFTSPLFAKTVMKSQGQGQLPTLMTKLACESLLAEPDKPAVRSAASSLAFNLTSTNHRIRREEDREALQEASQVELAAGLLELLSTETPTEKTKEVNSEALRTALTSFGYLVYCAPRAGEVADLCAALDAKATVGGLINSVKEVEKVAKEIVELLGRFRFLS